MPRRCHIASYFSLQRPIPRSHAEPKRGSKCDLPNLKTLAIILLWGCLSPQIFFRGIQVESKLGSKCSALTSKLCSPHHSRAATDGEQNLQIPREESLAAANTYRLTRELSLTHRSGVVTLRGSDSPRGKMPHGGSQTERGGMHSSMPNMKISEIGKLALRSQHMPCKMDIHGSL